MGPEFTQADIKDIVNGIQRIPKVVGERWALLDFRWYQKWALGFYSRDELGPFDNSELLQGDIEVLSFDIIENTHYVLIPEILYRKIKASYAGGPDIYRKIIVGHFGLPQVDLNIPIPLQFIKSSEPNKIITSYALKSESVGSMKNRMCRVFNLDPSEIKIWDFYKGTKHCELKVLEYISNSNLLENQLVLLEESVNLATVSSPCIPKHLKRITGFCTNCLSMVCNACNNKYHIQHNVIDQDEIGDYLKLEKQIHSDKLQIVTDEYNSIKDKLKNHFQSIYDALQVKEFETSREIGSYYDEAKDLYDINMNTIQSMESTLASKETFKGEKFELTDIYKLNCTLNQVDIQIAQESILNSITNLNYFIYGLDQARKLLNPNTGK